ncbi:MAG: host-nuclease inhibitor Gam family protein [Verrucomicrobiota bacterium]
MSKEGEAVKEAAGVPSNDPKIIVIIETAADAQAAMAIHAETQAERDKLKAELDRALAVARARFEARIAALDNELAQQTAALQQWATGVAATGADGAHSFSNGSKRLEFVAGYLGFRATPAKLELAGPEWTWDKVLEKLTKGFKRYIRMNPEVNKRALLADAEKLGKKLKRLGVCVRKGESFYVELKPSAPAPAEELKAA